MITDLLNDKKEIENKIKNMIIELEHKYGVIVDDINVFHIENRVVDPSYNKIVLSNVELDIKL